MRENNCVSQEEKILNTNETMNDYSFFFQMICENKPMDFESEEKLI
ncbi:MAG: hypothetical protein IH594_17510 [Bacteroidales bacterium]|nr:hypothetical protein [Bacteroidales bacterium]